jgi:UDP-2,4-diacetamido-2,4,6-trideoxy-beta-L-altropyranose hydrolase
LGSKKVVFRVDGSVQIGLGHLVRCMAMAQMLDNDFEISFVCKEIPVDIIKEIKELRYNLSIIENEDFFFNQLRDDTIVVLDHYDLGSDYQKSIKDKGCILVCIDDIYDKEFFADLIINNAPNINPLDYKAQTYTQFALGLDYVLLRPVFLSKAKARKITKVVETVFLCFGGSDIKNITKTVVEVLQNDARFKKVIIVAGGAYNYLADLKNTISTDKRFFLYHSIDGKTMSDLMAEAELAIVPCSGILQEVLTTGCKVVSGMYVENQKYMFENYKALGAFESAGNFSKEDILLAINRSCVGVTEFHNRYIDGKSGDRILKFFKQFKFADEVFLRNANESDLLKTFEWASNPEVRKFSFNTRPVGFKEHEDWFANKLKDDDCFYYIGVWIDKIFGSIRFDIDGEKAIISYLVDPLYQNKGLGTVLLKRGLDLLLTQSGKELSSVCGEVLFENMASIKIFQNMGYTLEVNSLVNLVKFKKDIYA